MARSPAEIAQGPIFIGVVLNICLYGIMITQTFLYFSTYKKDSLWIKCFVALLFFADTLNSVFDIVYLYNTLIVHFSEISALESANWVFDTDPVLTGIIAMLVQLFYAWRVKVLTANIWLVILVVACALTGLLGALATAIAAAFVPQFVNFRRFKVVVIIWLTAECVGDIIITTSLVFFLKKHKSGINKNTDTVINRIIRLTIQTGMVTSICAITDLILYLAKPTGLHLVFNMPLAKLYTNSLMSTLNARGGWNFAEEASRSSQDNLQVRSSQNRDRRPLQMSDVTWENDVPQDLTLEMADVTLPDCAGGSDKLARQVTQMA